MHLPLLRTAREKGINAEVFPDNAKIKKQLDYADRKKIPFVVIIGSDELQSGLLTLKI
jgi:histidyl-tRNA synthetase